MMTNNMYLPSLMHLWFLPTRNVLISTKSAQQSNRTMSWWTQTSNFGLLPPPKRVFMLFLQLHAFSWTQ